MEKRDMAIMGQAMVSALRAMRTHASIVSGDYKSRQSQRGLTDEEKQTWTVKKDPSGRPYCSVCGDSLYDCKACDCGVEWVSPIGKEEPLTPRWIRMKEAELLRSEMGVMSNHIDRCDEIIDFLLADILREAKRSAANSSSSERP